jgi:hypothetical protein
MTRPMNHPMNRPSIRPISRLRNHPMTRSSMEWSDGRVKEALINATVHDCDWDFAQNRGNAWDKTRLRLAAKHSFTGGKASIFNEEFGQNNNADMCWGINQ